MSPLCHQENPTPLRHYFNTRPKASCRGPCWAAVFSLFSLSEIEAVQPVQPVERQPPHGAGSGRVEVFDPSNPSGKGDFMGSEVAAANLSAIVIEARLAIRRPTGREAAPRHGARFSVEGIEWPAAAPAAGRSTCRTNEAARALSSLGFVFDCDWRQAAASDPWGMRGGRKDPHDGATRVATRSEGRLPHRAERGAGRRGGRVSRPRDDGRNSRSGLRNHSSDARINHRDRRSGRHPELSTGVQCGSRRARNWREQRSLRGGGRH